MSAPIASLSRKRKIDLPENALAWLRPYRTRQGAIFDHDFRAPTGPGVQGGAGHLQTQRSRHSFGSYRMEMRSGMPDTSALEMGNSAAIVMRHYFDIVETRAAHEYGTSDRCRAAIGRS